MSLSSQYKELKKLVPQKGELVLGYGDPGARIMVIGEAPGREEVLAGRPFVGKAGRNLDEFLKEAGISRSALYLTNVVKFRPVRIGKKGTTANRPPTKAEIAACAPYLEAEIAAISPELILTLGNIALQALMGEKAKIGQFHGKALSYGKGFLFALYHPASVLYNPKLRQVYLEDLARLRTYLTRSGKSSRIEELRREAD